MRICVLCVCVCVLFWNSNGCVDIKFAVNLYIRQLKARESLVSNVYLINFILVILFQEVCRYFNTAKTLFEHTVEFETFSHYALIDRPLHVA